MIRTTTEVSYDIRNLSKTAIKYADITQVVRMPQEKNYYLIIEEWVIIDDKKDYVNNKTVKMSYEDSNALTDFLDANFEIEETKTERRDKYTVLGHFITNNKDQVYNTSWELC